MNLDPTKSCLSANIRAADSEQDYRRRDDDYSGVALEEIERSGDDAVSREEEHFIGRARPGIAGRVKVGFAKDGRITALDMYTVTNAGSYDASGTAGRRRGLSRYCISRRRCAGVCDGDDEYSAAQRAKRAGGMQGIAIIEPVLAKAARQLGVDQVALRDVNCLRASGIRGAES